jgi:hypothetical protein
MRFAVVLACMLAEGLLVQQTLRADPIVISFPGPPAINLQIDVEIDGQPPAKAWNDYLDRVFDFFDADADGLLDKGEIARIFPLPLTGRKELKLDLTSIKRAKTGHVTRAELKGYCENHGFGPIALALEPPSAEDARLGRFFRNLDLKSIDAIFRKHDLNDDERLDLSEILASATVPSPTPEPSAKLAAKNAKPDARLHVKIGKAPSATADSRPDNSLSLVADPVVPIFYRLRESNGSWTASVVAAKGAVDIRSVRDFLRAQFRAALSDKQSATRAEIFDDLTLSGLQSLFPFADRNGDDRLSPAELDGYLDLIEAGIHAQIWIKIADRGRNPFPVLDANRDGILDLRESKQAPAFLRVKDGQLPRSFQVAFASPASIPWGGVALPAIKSQPTAARETAAPSWFQALDRNRDGWISPREFSGSPQLFRKLDRNGDGLIEPAEAQDAK